MHKSVVVDEDVSSRCTTREVLVWAIGGSGDWGFRALMVWVCGIFLPQVSFLQDNLEGMC